MQSKKDEFCPIGTIQIKNNLKNANKKARKNIPVPEWVFHDIFYWLIWLSNSDSVKNISSKQKDSLDMLIHWVIGKEVDCDG